MKKRMLAALLSLALICSMTPAAWASKALGWELHRSVTTLGAGVTLTEQLLWGDSKSDFRREFYLTYTPNDSVRPQVAYGSTVLSTSTLTALAQSIEATGKRVLGGANGDYFVMATGAPLGLVVTEGILRSSSSYHYALAFDEEGKAVVGKPNTQIWADLGGYHLLCGGGYNKSRGSDGMTLFNSDFGATTKTTSSGIDVVLRPVTLPEGYQFPELETETVTVDAATGEVVDPTASAPESGESGSNLGLEGAESGSNLGQDGAESGANSGQKTDGNGSDRAPETTTVTRYTQASLDALVLSSAALPSAQAELKIGQTVECVVDQVIESSAAINIPKGYFVLSLDAKTGTEFHKNELKSLQKGENVTLSVTAEDERFVGTETAIGAYELLLKDGAVADGLATSADPRTAVGVKADGSVILYALDGRQSGYSVGGSIKQVAQRLQELGCVDAVLFDGGGSTSFGATEAEGERFTLLNQPSGGSQRRVSNGLFFVSELSATGIAGSLSVTAAEEMLLCGAETTLSAAVIDTGYYPTGEKAENVRYTAEGGSVSGNVVTIGPQAGEVVVTGEATAEVTTETGESAQKTITGQTLLTAVATPHAITVKNEANGAAVSALNLEPNESVSLTATAVWRTMTLKSRDECFTWSLSEGLGTIDAAGTLTAGSQGGRGTLTVSAGEKSVSIPVVVGGHVNTLNDCETEEGFTADTATAAVDTAEVKYGAAAWRIDYSAGESRLQTALNIPQGDSYFGFWAKGSGEALTITAEVLLADGTTAERMVYDRPFSGWKQLMIPLPEGAAAVTALVLEGEAAGSVTVDQFISANDALYDTTPPEVTLEISGGKLTARLSDNVDRSFNAGQVTVTKDGKEIAFTLKGDTVTAVLDSQGAHRYSVTVTDASGNCVRAGTMSGDAGESPFIDTAGHWAEEYAAYLFTQGVTEGSFDQVGRIFEPSKNITRGEFATMLARWLGVNFDDYAAVELPFADRESIPAWALGAVKALYAHGIFNGSGEADGLYAFCDQPLSRAQAITMLGRVQRKGFQSAAERFDDHEDIPAWAEEYVYLLAGQGVVSGYNGLVRPQDPITRGEVAKLLTTMW